MRRIAFSIGCLLLMLGTAIAAWPSSSKFPNGVTPSANPIIWSFCYPSPGPGIVSPCTANGTISTSATISSVRTMVSKWNSTITPAGPLRDGSTFGHLQVVFQGPTSGTLAITAAYIGAAQTSGGGKCSTNTSFCQWDFANGNCPNVSCAQLLFSGSGSVNITGNVQKASDILAFTIDSTKPLIIAYNTLSTSAYTSEVPGSTNTSPVGTNTGWFNSYILNGTAQAATGQKNSGYTNQADTIRGIVKITGSP